MSLFPAVFSEAHPFPSFNVWDLHTVDNGVVSVLLPLLGVQPPAQVWGCDSPPCRPVPPVIPKPSPWSLFVGHFLGVDHVGHHLHADAPEMTVKLAQLDGVLSAVVPALGNDTLLVVLGDHGMRRS